MFMVDKNIIKNNFSKYAKFYDKYSIIQNLCASKLISKIQTNGFKKILDIGCGTGNYTKLLRAKFPFAQIKAIDISKEMIELAKKKFPEDSIKFSIIDAEKIGFNEKFDFISSNATFQWFENLEKTLKRLKKILNKDGLISFSIFGPLTFYELDESLQLFGRQSVRVSASSFIGKEKIEKILKGIFGNFNIERQIYKEKFSSLKELLNRIKYTGTKGNGIRSFWTANTISKIEDIYKEKFKNIIATYQVFFCKTQA